MDRNLNVQPPLTLHSLVSKRIRYVGCVKFWESYPSGKSIVRAGRRGVDGGGGGGISLLGRGGDPYPSGGKREAGTEEEKSSLVP